MKFVPVSWVLANQSVENMVAVTGPWARAYFIVFYVIGVVGVLNIVVARVVSEHGMQLQQHLRTKKLVESLLEGRARARGIGERNRLVEFIATFKSHDRHRY